MTQTAVAFDHSPIDELTASLPEPERSRVRAVLKTRHARILRLAQAPVELREAEVSRNLSTKESQ